MSVGLSVHRYVAVLTTAVFLAVTSTSLPLPQPLSILPGTFELSADGVRLAAQCLAHEGAVPLAENIFSHAGGGLTVTRTVGGISETKPLDDVLGKWVELKGAESTLHIDARVIDKTPGATFKLTSTGDIVATTKAELQKATGSVADIKAELTAAQKTVSALQTILGEDSPVVQEAAYRLLQQTWRYQAGEGAFSAKAFREQLAPAGISDLLSVRKGRLLTAKEAASFHLDIDVDDQMLVKLRGQGLNYTDASPAANRIAMLDWLEANEPMTIQRLGGATTIAPKDIVKELSAFKGTGNDLLVSSSLTPEQAAILARAKFTSARTIERALAHPIEVPLKTKFVLVSSKDPNEVAGMWLGQEPNRIAGLTEQFMTNVGADASLASTRAALKKAITIAPGERRIVLFDNSLDFIHFADGDKMPIQELEGLLAPDDGSLSCSLYSAQWKGYTTTKKLDLKMLLDAATNAKRNENKMLGEITSEIVEHFDTAVAAQAEKSKARKAAVAAAGVALIAEGGTIWWVDATRKPLLSIADATQPDPAVEKNAPAAMVFRVYLENDAPERVSFKLTTLSDTAEAEKDFEPLASKPFAIEAGAKELLVRIPLIALSAASEGKSFRVIVHAVEGATVAKDQACGVIESRPGRK